MSRASGKGKDAAPAAPGALRGQDIYGYVGRSFVEMQLDQVAHGARCRLGKQARAYLAEHTDEPHRRAYGRGLWAGIQDERGRVRRVLP